VSCVGCNHKYESNTVFNSLLHLLKTCGATFYAYICITHGRNSLQARGLIYIYIYIYIYICVCVCVCSNIVCVSIYNSRSKFVASARTEVSCIGCNHKYESNSVFSSLLHVLNM